MSYSFRPAVRLNTPLIVGLAGPTKSGKTFSAHRLARGMAGENGVVAMINAEGARGHQYADKFNYLALDITAPFSPEKYTAAITAAKELKPGALILDSASHCHDGPGGLLEMHDSELDRMAGDDYKKRERMTWAAWIRPKKLENEFIYALLSCDFPVVLCFRAKEKIKIVKGSSPIDLGWQPIASDRITFETIFTLMLPPHCKGVPDLSISEMRTPFDDMVPAGRPLDEDLGRRLAEWARGGSKPASGAPAGDFIHPDQHTLLSDKFRENEVPLEPFLKKAKLQSLAFLPAADYQRTLNYIDAVIEARRKSLGA